MAYYGAPVAYAVGAALYAMPFQPQNPAAWALFQGVDRDRSGQVSQAELQLALSNGGWTAFSPRTTKLLMRMFDTDRSGECASS
jgi:Ca2+-binding EF-hand superfamily protein